MRLIDADELLKAMNTWDKFGYNEHCKLVRNENAKYVPYVHYEDMTNCVKNMPTTYNVKKVIEQLEIYLMPIVGRKSKLYNTVLDIVRKGGAENE